MESIMEEPPSLERSEWSTLLGELPLFPPAPHPPPALFPLLSPLLQQKLGLLSLGRGRGWPGTLTWLPHDLSYKVNERLKTAWLAEGLEERFRGYRRFDDETILANVALRKPDLEFWFCWIPQQEGQTMQAGWKLHDIRLPEVDMDLNWFSSITEATKQFKGADGLRDADIGESQSDDDDGYWDQYDQATGIQGTGVKTPNTPKVVTPSLPLDISNDAYYDQYDHVETTIGDGKLMEHHQENHGPNITEQPGGVGNAVPVVRINDVLDNGLHDYIRNTVRNLSEFAQKSGMTKTRLTELVHEGLNLA